jgi:ADP-heptose:LPS heptosyltransferase
VVALPSFHLIARAFPNAERRLLTNFPVHAKAPASAAVLDGSGLVTGYMRYTAGTRNPLELVRLIAEIRSFRPEVVVYLMHTRSRQAIGRDRLFFRLAGVRRLACVPPEERIMFHFDSGSGLYEKEVARLARMTAELGDAGPLELANWDLRLSDAERASAHGALGDLAGRPLVVCGPGTKMRAKDWGQDNWRALLQRIEVEYPGHGLALVGAPEEAAAADHAAQQWTGPKVNLCGLLTPRETAAVLEQARIFLGPDSGPMHLAAAAGVPCVIAFSAAGLPGIWFPPGDKHQIVYHQTACCGCFREKCNVEGHPCLSSITVDEMAEAVDRAVRGQDGAPPITRIGERRPLPNAPPDTILG